MTCLIKFFFERFLFLFLAHKKPIHTHINYQHNEILVELEVVSLILAPDTVKLLLNLRHFDKLVKKWVQLQDRVVSCQLENDIIV